MHELQSVLSFSQSSFDVFVPPAVISIDHKSFVQASV